MLRRLKSLVTLPAPPKKKAPLKGLMALKAIPDDPSIPAYPPHPKGLPAVDPRKALRKHFDALAAYQRMTDLSPEEFDELLLPTIERFAGIAHLLPASQSHHHRGAGGLLQHSLEVARYAVQFTRSVVFVPFGTPLERRTMEPRWRMVTGLAGLLHDGGKPFSDVRVVDKDGRVTWEPFQETLPEWAQRHQIENYFVRWQDRRHKHHHTYNNAVANLVIQPNLVAWLRQGGEELWVTLNQVLSHQIPDHRIAKMVMDADRGSVEIDLKRNPSLETQSYAIPVERHLLGAMNRLLEDGTWKVNEPGARVWVDSEHAYIVWKAAVQDIHDHLLESYVPGMPRGSEVLADILIERDLAVMRQIDLDTKYRYWPIIPGPLRKEGEKPIVLYALRLASKQQLWDQPPPPTDLVVGDDAERELAEWFASTGEHENEDPHTPGRAKPLSINAKRKEALRARPPSGEPAAPEPAEPQAQLPLIEDDGELPPPAQERRPSTKDRPEPTVARADQPDRAIQAPPAAPASPLPAPPRPPAAQEPPRTPEPAASPAAPPPAIDAEAAKLLERMAGDVREGRHTLGDALCEVGEGRLLIRYPEGAKLYAEDPLALVRALREGNAIEIDPWTKRPTKTIGKVTGLELTPAACAAVRAVLRRDRGQGSVEPGPGAGDDAKPTASASAPGTPKRNTTAKEDAQPVSDPGEPALDPESQRKLAALESFVAEELKQGDRNTVSMTKLEGWAEANGISSDQLEALLEVSQKVIRSKRTVRLSRKRQS